MGRDLPVGGAINFERRVRDETVAELRAGLGEDGYAAVYAEGVDSRSRALAPALRPG